MLETRDFLFSFGMSFGEIYNIPTSVKQCFEDNGQFLIVIQGEAYWGIMMV